MYNMCALVSDVVNNNNDNCAITSMRMSVAEYLDVDRGRIEARAKWSRATPISRYIIAHIFEALSSSSGIRLK